MTKKIEELTILDVRKYICKKIDCEDCMLYDSYDYQCRAIDDNETEIGLEESTLLDYCKEQLKKYPDIKEFEYKKKGYHKEQFNEDVFKTKGYFMSEAIKETYIDYDGTDENGPIYLKKRWLVCKVKKVGE